MRILCVLASWPNLYATYIFNEIAWLKKRGHHVAVASLQPAASGVQANLAHFGLEDVAVLQLKQEYDSEEDLIGEVIRFACQQQIQIVNAHQAREPADIARHIRIRTGIPYAVRMHGGDVHSNPSPNLAHIVEHASVICPVSRFLADVLQGKRIIDVQPRGLPVRVDADKLRVCHHGIPAESIAREPARQCDELVIIGSIGRVMPVKRHQDICEAVAGLIEDVPGLRVRIIGGGDLTTVLQALAQSLGIAERVEITGPQAWPEMMQLASEVHIYVQASQLEGFCLATLEGAAHGVPLVATRTGIHEEYIESGINGYLFDAGDVPALRRHLRHLIMLGPARRRQMGAASLAILNERFLLDTHMRRLEAIFQSVISGDPLPA